MIWDESPIRAGDHVTLKAGGPGGRKDPPPETEQQPDEVIWRQDMPDEWMRYKPAESDERDWLLRPGDLTIDQDPQITEDIERIDELEILRRSLPLPRITGPRYVNVLKLTMNDWGEVRMTSEARRYVKPKKVIYKKRRFQREDQQFRILRRKPGPVRVGQLMDESALPDIVKGLGDLPTDKTSKLEIPLPISVRVKCGGSVRRMAGYWVNDITNTLIDEGQMSEEFEIWTDRGPMRKYEILRRGMFIQYITEAEKTAGVKCMIF
jgi:hypothetical protein